MQRLHANIRPGEELRAADREEMYALYASYYAGSSFPRFAADLAEKDYVIELREEGALRGFSTLLAIDFHAAGMPRRALFSGDTIIAQDNWGEQTLATAFCRIAGAHRAADPATPLYWFLITKGHRTYRYLGAFAREYFPHPLEPTPPLAAECIDTLARSRFGNFWKPDLGIVHFDGERGHLRPEVAQPRPALSARADVRFFLERNPGYSEGDELCCLAELAASNLRSHARRAFLEGYNEGPRFLSFDRRLRIRVPTGAAPGTIGAAAAAHFDPSR